MDVYAVPWLMLRYPSYTQIYDRKHWSRETLNIVSRLYLIYYLENGDYCNNTLEIWNLQKNVHSWSKASDKQICLQIFSPAIIWHVSWMWEAGKWETHRVYIESTRMFKKTRLSKIGEWEFSRAVENIESGSQLYMQVI